MPSQASLLRSVEPLLHALALQDSETVAHCRRVADTARELALLLGRTNREQGVAYLAGLCHDLGKFAVLELIRDTKVWSEDQRLAVQSHSEAGAALLRLVPGLPPEVAQAAAEHHERLDGSGYPSGVRAMPQLSSIVALADILDAIQSRPRFSRGTALAEVDALAQRAQLPLDVCRAGRAYLQGASALGSG